MASTAVVTQFPLEKEYSKKTATKADVAKLRQWLETQPHLPGEHITELDLILTYHCCDRSAEVSKQVLDLHYTLKTLFALFKNRTIDDAATKSLRTVLLSTLRGRSREGHAVFFGRVMDSDAKNFVFADAVKLAFMVIDLWQYEEGSWPGLVIIIDLQGVVASHLARLDLQTLQHLFYFLQEAMLLKIKGIHFLNAPSFMDRIMLLIRPFFKRELLDMLHIHQVGADTLDAFVPVEVLPKPSGKEFMGFKQYRDETEAKLKANSEFFVAESKKRVTEAQRPGKPKTISDIFGGVEGSFKKLDID